MKTINPANQAVITDGTPLSTGEAAAGVAVAGLWMGVSGLLSGIIWGGAGALLANFIVGRKKKRR